MLQKDETNESSDGKINSVTNNCGVGPNQDIYNIISYMNQFDATSVKI